ncbi:hypothetical protein FGO68_gene4251 [Halteria grandinella]|uniref:E3 ubiquitin-protein ligase RNF182 n=1 Tax=Halteria grandinella TaxID=5974 RepID=A0A8J8P7R1_HALGN|nr:hypothetical protein FGO68_gene4251 [Halteria grandinella]
MNYNIIQMYTSQEFAYCCDQVFEQIMLQSERTQDSHQMKEELSCQICFNVFNLNERYPMVLDCGHTFCDQCLCAMINSQNDGIFQCPLDKQQNNTISRNYALSKVVEKYFDQLHLKDNSLKLFCTKHPTYQIIQYNSLNRTLECEICSQI